MIDNFHQKKILLKKYNPPSLKENLAFLCTQQCFFLCIFAICSRKRPAGALIRAESAGTGCPLADWTLRSEGAVVSHIGLIERITGERPKPSWGPGIPLAGEVTEIPTLSPCHWAVHCRTIRTLPCLGRGHSQGPVGPAGPTKSGGHLDTIPPSLPAPSPCPQSAPFLASAPNLSSTRPRPLPPAPPTASGSTQTASAPPRAPGPLPSSPQLSASARPGVDRVL